MRTQTTYRINPHRIAELLQTDEILDREYQLGEGWEKPDESRRGDTFREKLQRAKRLRKARKAHNRMDAFAIVAENAPPPQARRAAGEVRLQVRDGFNPPDKAPQDEEEVEVAQIEDRPDDPDPNEVAASGKLFPEDWLQQDQAQAEAKQSAE